MTSFFTHPLVAPEKVQLRDYQVEIATDALKQNTLVILPTGLGKTVCALLVMVPRLTESLKVIMVAPTKPLCEQHYQFFSGILPYTSVRLLIGELPVQERVKDWDDAQLVIATPQTLENDLKNYIYDLKDVSLLIIDEAHRAVGAYAYTFLAGEYQATSQNPLILAMTASPGGDEEKVNLIKDSLFITRVISKTEDDPDVTPYLHEKEIITFFVELPDILNRASKTFKEIVESRCKALNAAGFKINPNPTQTQLNQLNHHFTALISQKDPAGFEFARLYGEIMKMRHAVKVSETQGLIPLRKYLHELFTEGMKAGAKGATKRLVQEETLQATYQEISDAGNDEIHPKAVRLPGLVEIQLAKDPGLKILIFAEFRDTVALIVSLLKAHGIAATPFTGQSRKGEEKGMNQKQQVEILNRFRSGEIRVLVSTCVGEEGLDIPATDVVIFYEPVPSEVRSIQRRGRTGRFALGTVLVMITKGTQDEINYYVSQRKEHNMKNMDHTTRQMKVGDI
ncbi:MAG TPA: helicase-related protein [Methanospirillum sp.]|nr:helicase-related protein [Methanospirillum sp.]